MRGFWSYFGIGLCLCLMPPLGLGLLALRLIPSPGPGKVSPSAQTRRGAPSIAERPEICSPGAPSARDWGKIDAYL